MKWQECITESEFLRILEDIESKITCDNKALYGKKVFVDLGRLNNQDTFSNTSVADIKAVDGGNINIRMLACPADHCSEIDIANLGIYELRDAKNGEFRGQIPYTPPETLAMTSFLYGTDGKYIVSKHPVKQTSKGFQWLDYTLASNTEKSKYCHPERIKYYTTIAQRIIDIYYDVTNSCGIVYSYRGVDFVFPMELDYVKELLKDRERENGRKAILPTIVNRHKRKGKTIGYFLRSSKSDKPITYKNRQFGVLIGSELYGYAFDTPGGTKRIKKHIESAVDNRIGYELI